MSTRFAWIFAAVLMVACGDDATPEQTDDETDDESGSKRDASVKRDASTKDAGKKDAEPPSDDDDSDDGSGDDGSGDDGDDGDDAAVDDEPEEDAGAPVQDAGKADAGKADAGKADAGTSTSDAGGASGCDALTYDSFGKAFLTKYCVSCHGPTMAQAMVHLDSLSGVTAKKADAKMEVTRGSMPPIGTKPTADEKTKFGMWIDCGPK